MANPIAVLISDVHYNLNTLAVADAAMRQAISKANELGIPLIVAGDLHDTKANLRGECVNAMIETFKLCDEPPYVIIGNHCKINEKGSEHSLNFLESYASLVKSPVYVYELGSWLIPYYSNSGELQQLLDRIDKPARLIMHQGVMSAKMGHYVQDKTSLPPGSFADFRVVSGHYHVAQDVKCGRPRKGAVGLFSYVGNPYTLSFGEVNDPSKGFAVLHDNGILERIPTNLRSHVVIKCDAAELPHPDLMAYYPKRNVEHGDLVWLKVSGTHSQLAKLSKSVVANITGFTEFKLDLIPTDAPALEVKTEKMTGTEIMDSLIDREAESAEEKAALKKLWRETYEGT